MLKRQMHSLETDPELRNMEKQSFSEDFFTPGSVHFSGVLGTWGSS